MKSFKLFLRKEFETVFERILTEFEGAMRASRPKIRLKAANNRPNS